MGETDPTQAYTFDVTIGGVTQNLTLTSGQSYTYSDLKDGTTWSVTETSTNPEGWTTTVNGVTGTTASGTIQSGQGSAATFVNTVTGKLTVSKTVAGAESDDTDFDFTLTYGGTTQTFTLKSGGAQSFNIPAGVAFTVSETDPGEGWMTNHQRQ